MTPQDRELFTLMFCSTNTLRLANPDGTFKDLTLQQMARLLPRRFPGFKQEWVKFFLDTSSGSSGLKWSKVTSSPPFNGKRLMNAALSEALQTKLEFTQAEFDVFQIECNLTINHYVEAGGEYFQPAAGLRIHKKLERADAMKDKKLTIRLLNGENNDGVMDKNQSEFLAYYIAHSQICWNFYCSAFGCSNEASKHCAKCKVAHYCSRECQIRDFPTHKVSCPDLCGFDRQEHLGSRA